MSTVLLAGTGQVGVRAARQLADTPGVTRLLIASRDPRRSADLAIPMGDKGEGVAIDGWPTPRVPAGVDAVAVATEPSATRPWVLAAADAGIPVAVVGSEELADLEVAAARTGAPIVSGCGFAAGLSDVLARHAADLFETVDEVHVARVGADDTACAEALRRARSSTPGEWRDGAWRTDRAFGPELLWFPEPVGARECQLVRDGVTATVAAVAGVRHVTVRLGPPPPPAWRRRLRRDPLDTGWGAIRVEVTGWRNGIADSVVYGAVDRTAVVAGMVLAVTAGGLAGALEAGVAAPAGVRPLGAVVEPVPFLSELARRGVKAATFEGVVPAG